jgi:hypothetical protein
VVRQHVRSPVVFQKLESAATNNAPSTTDKCRALQRRHSNATSKMRSCVKPTGCAVMARILKYMNPHIAKFYVIAACSLVREETSR